MYSMNLHLADLYNYSITLVLAYGFGTKQKDGHFDGAIGLIERKVVNMSISGFQYIVPRLEVADFLYPLYVFNFAFFFKQPRALGTYRALSLQLDTIAWLSLGVMIITSLLVYWIFQLIYMKTNRPDDEATVSAATIQVIGIMSQQGLSHEPGRLSGRILCTFILMLALMVCTYYNAATMNALLSPAPISIRNLQELISSSLHLVLMNVPYFTTKVTRERLLSKAVNNRVVSKPNFTAPLEDGLDLILKGGAFCGEDFTMFTAIQNRFKDNEKCDLSVIPAMLPVPTGNYLEKYSQYRELFFRGNLRMKEHGLAHRQRNYWYPQKPSCAGNQVSVK
ncbi:hypothetical protein O3M35_001779 [Rhynocoris fuscipes]|uniref:Ionotropic glutamate receptor C-terminal domain-containing protein n=1 Tax=Rhynocoris fuscipes TaxID=488301 RepID=A0AAW1CQ40_9HEMI